MFLLAQSLSNLWDFAKILEDVNPNTFEGDFFEVFYRGLQPSVGSIMSFKRQQKSASHSSKSG